jgi:serine/threonine protein kinase
MKSKSMEIEQIPAPSASKIKKHAILTLGKESNSKSYELLKLLSPGTNCKVKLGRDIGTNILYALKIYKSTANFNFANLEKEFQRQECTPKRMIRVTL